MMVNDVFFGGYTMISDCLMVHAISFPHIFPIYVLNEVTCQNMSNPDPSYPKVTIISGSLSTNPIPLLNTP